MQPSISKEERKLAVLKAQEARDKVFKLVVKIISWETGSLNSLVVKSSDKITSKEWSTYKKHTLAVASSENIERVKQKLIQTFKDIKENGGFEQ